MDSHSIQSILGLVAIAAPYIAQAHDYLAASAWSLNPKVALVVTGLGWLSALAGHLTAKKVIANAA